MTPGTSQPARPRAAATPPQSGGPVPTGPRATNGLNTITFDDLNRYYQGGQQSSPTMTPPDPSVGRGVTPPAPRPQFQPGPNTNALQGPYNTGINGTRTLPPPTHLPVTGGPDPAASGVSRGAYPHPQTGGLDPAMSGAPLGGVTGGMSPGGGGFHGGINNGGIVFRPAPNSPPVLSRSGGSVTGDPRGMTGTPTGGGSGLPLGMGGPVNGNGQVPSGSYVPGGGGFAQNPTTGGVQTHNSVLQPPAPSASGGTLVSGLQGAARTGGFGGTVTGSAGASSLPFGPPGTPGVPQGGMPPQPPPGSAPTPGSGFQLPQSVQQLLSQLNGPSPGTIQSNLNTSNVPGLPSGQQLTGAMNQAQQAAYQQATGYLDPQFQNQESALRSQLTNQGIPQNSEAWNRAMDDFQRQRTFAYSQAQQNAVQQGNAAQAQLFGQGLAANQNQFGQNLAGGQFANSAQNQQAQQLLARLGLSTQLGTAAIGGQTAWNQLQEQMAQNNFNNSLTTRQQGIQEMLLQQQNPLQMYQALMQGNNVTQPNFPQVPGANIGNTDIASIIQQALGQQNNTYNTQMGAQNSQTAGYAAILAALLSDRRLKRNIICIGMHEAGVPLYAYEYLWGEPGVGVMADELERVKPEAVFDVGGIKIVDYARL